MSYKSRMPPGEDRIRIPTHARVFLKPQDVTRCLHGGTVCHHDIFVILYHAEWM
ncbi:hypothetical protein ARMGADRAFT_1087022 [Armillaria gallica]|uniref:Uncharacterized protein n=1 Tax=Armillaria gallica TaxID=47427 RepID=A0A2H3CVX5_ARMGA|nr:hypothetical protein ARMGADRAFT_1087022 [Armillaria gallica]